MTAAFRLKATIGLREVPPSQQARSATDVFVFDVEFGEYPQPMRERRTVRSGPVGGVAALSRPEMAAACIEEAFKDMPPPAVLRGQRIVRVGKSFREPIAAHLR